MRRSGLDTRTLLAIAVGGIIGALVRWLIMHDFDESLPADWFAYSPNTSVAIGASDAGVLEPVRSTQTIAGAGGLPVDTLLGNLMGCLLLGALTLLLTRSTGSRRSLQIGAATGFCGSLTTFSTFVVEIAALLRGKPILAPEVQALNVISVEVQPAIPTALSYIALSIAGGALAFWLGRVLADRIIPTAEVSTSGGAT